jgi:hypothetical protein
VSNVYSNESIFEATNNRSGDFDYSKISNSDLVVLNGISDLSPALLRSLQGFVEKGGSVLVFPSKEINQKSYEAFATQFQLPGITTTQADTSFKNSFELQVPDFSNPFFSNVFEKKEARMTMPFAIPSVSWGKKGEVLLKYKNGEVFLSMIHSGKGSIYLASAPMEAETTSLPKHSFFVPLMYKIAFNCIVSSERLSYSFQEKSTAIDLGEDKSLGTGSVYALEGVEFNMLPSQWISGDLLMLDLPAEQMKAGFYALSLNGEKVKTIALNYGRKESRMEGYTVEELKKIVAPFKNVKVYTIENSDQFTDAFRDDNLGTPLWKYFLWGALLFLMVEIVLIRFWK